MAIEWFSEKGRNYISGIYVTVSNTGLGFNKGAMSALGNPSNIVPGTEKERRLIAIKVSENGYKLTKRAYCFIYSKILMEHLKSVFPGLECGSYKAFFDNEEKALIIDLENGFIGKRKYQRKPKNEEESKCN